MRGFRVWHTKLNRYLKDEEFYIGSDGAVYSLFEVYDDEIAELGCIESFSREDFDRCYAIREDDTGLKDKNGKEIYEGDILKFRGRFYKVVFDDYGQFCLENKKYHWIENRYSFNSVAVWNGDGILVEIIGNIHENQELLGSKNVD